ncbi:MAG: fibronectin type III domain-containing protein [Dehalococcoidia bacterium]|nr:fibronectin type III domain-containing protein [Dehalococcoidia bacterium]
MSRKTRKLIWAVPLLAVFAVAGALAIFAAQTPQPAQADHVDLPGAVTGLKATAKSRTSIELTWNAPQSDNVLGNDIGGAPTGYRIDYADDSRSWVQLVADTGSTATSYMVTENVDDKTARHYRAFALNEAGTGPVSHQPVTAYVRVADSFPAMGPDQSTFILTATPVGANQVDLSWTMPTERGISITGYRVVEMVNADAVPDNALTECPAAGTYDLGGDTTTPTLCLHIDAATQMTKRTAEHKDDPATAAVYEGVRAGTTHYYRGIAQTQATTPGSATNPETASNIVGVTTAALKAPAAPTEPVAVATETDNNVQFYWIDSTDDGGHPLGDYEVEQRSRTRARAVATDSWGGWADWTGWTDTTITPNTTPSNVTPFNAITETALTPDTDTSETQWEFRVRAVQDDDPPGYDLKSGWAKFNAISSSRTIPITVPVPAAGAVDRTDVPHQTVVTAVPLDAMTDAQVGNRVTWTRNDGRDGVANNADDPTPFPDNYRIDVWVPDNDDGATGIDNAGGGTWQAGVRRTITLNQWEDLEAGPKKSHGYRVIPIHGNYHGMAGYATSIATASADASTPPSAVLNLRQCGATANSITMCWGAATGADAYDIYKVEPHAIDDAPGAWGTTALESDLTETTYLDKGLDPGDVFWYRVVSKKGATLVTVGAEAKGSTLSGGMPGAPVGLVAEVAADSNFPSPTQRGSLLMWNAPVAGDDAYAYQIQRMVNDGAWTTIVANTRDDISATQALYTHYNDQKELASDSHAYRVAAISGDGVGPYSNVAYVPPKVVVHNEPPMTVGMIADMPMTTGDMPSTMDVMGYFSDAEGDALTYSAMSSDDAVATAMVAEGTSMLTVTPMGVGTATIRVMATDMDGSGMSATQTFDVMVTIGLAAPSNVRVDPQGSGLVQVEWDTAAGAHGYTIVAINLDDSPNEVKVIDDPDAVVTQIVLPVDERYNIYVWSWAPGGQFETDFSETKRGVLVE